MPWVCLQFVIVVFPDHTHYFCHGRHYIALPNIFANQNRQEGKDQELIQSSTAPFPGYHMGKLHIHKKTSHTGEPRSQLSKQVTTRLHYTDRKI